MKKDFLGKIANAMETNRRTLKVARVNSSKINLKRAADTEKYADKISKDNAFSEFFKTRVAIKHRDVFAIRLDYECGKELSGRHFAVAINDSKEEDPMVTVVPLKSFKGILNPRSDVNLGIVKGTTSKNESIALINQIKAIDKCRLFEQASITEMKRIYNEIKVAEDEEIVLGEKVIYRLDEEQWKILTKALYEFYTFGFIKHKKY